VNFGKRVFYNYWLRSFSVASIELCSGVTLLAFGTAVGVGTDHGAPAREHRHERDRCSPRSRC
jgi:hypothetical protein